VCIDHRTERRGDVFAVAWLASRQSYQQRGKRAVLVERTAPAPNAIQFAS